MCNLEVKHERDEDVKLCFLLKIKTRLKITHFSSHTEEYLIKIHVDATKKFFFLTMINWSQLNAGNLDKIIWMNILGRNMNVVAIQWKLEHCCCISKGRILFPWYCFICKLTMNQKCAANENVLRQIGLNFLLIYTFAQTRIIFG